MMNSLLFPKGAAALVVSMVLTTSLFASTSQAAAEKMYGVFMVVKGSVKVQSSGSGTGNDVKVGSKIFEGDSVTTAADSRAKIVMADRNVVNISPDTVLKISTYKNNAATGEKNVEMKLLSGKVRNDVEQSYDGVKNKFLIKSRTAVAGVRGTKLVMSLDKVSGATSVYTIQGSVAVSSLSANGMAIGSPVIVGKGEMTTALMNKSAETPKPVPQEEMKKVEQESLAYSPSPIAGNRDVASVKDSGPAAAEAGAPAPKMIDSKDLDVSAIAKAIPPAPRLPTAAPGVGAAPMTPKIDTRPKTTTVIIRPTPTN